MKPFRRRDAVLGFLAVFPLPLWESHLIDRALREGLGYLNYNKSPLLFVDVTILTLLLAVSYWFEKRTFTSGVWWFKKDENTQLLPGGGGPISGAVRSVWRSACWLWGCASGSASGGRRRFRWSTGPRCGWDFGCCFPAEKNE